jgi:hypothetical protein
LKIAGSVGRGLKGAYELSLLKTMTVVGTGRVELHLGKQSCEHSRNCSSFSPTFPDVLFVRISEHEKVLRTHADPRVFAATVGVLGNYDEKTED